MGLVTSTIISAYHFPNNLNNCLNTTLEQTHLSDDVIIVEGVILIPSRFGDNGHLS